MHTHLLYKRVHKKKPNNGLKSCLEYFFECLTMAECGQYDLSCILVCTLIDPNQYFRGVQVPSVSSKIYHTIYEKYLHKYKVYKCTFHYILENWNWITWQQMWFVHQGHCNTLQGHHQCWCLRQWLNVNKQNKKNIVSLSGCVLMSVHPILWLSVSLCVSKAALILFFYLTWIDCRTLEIFTYRCEPTKTSKNEKWNQK